MKTPQLKFLMRPELEEQVLASVAAGRPLQEICTAVGMTLEDLWDYRRKHLQFHEAFNAARIEGCDAIMEEIRAMGVPARNNPEALGTRTAPDGKPATWRDPAMERVRLDALKFYAARVAPDRYGDRVDVNVRGRLDMTAILTAADTRLLASRADNVPYLERVDAGAAPLATIGGARAVSSG